MRGETRLRDADNSPTLAVVEAVADREGVDSTDLPPLGAVVDPDALDCLFAYSTDEPPRPRGHVEFEYCGYAVAVHSDGQIAVEA